MYPEPRKTGSAHTPFLQPLQRETLTKIRRDGIIHHTTVPRQLHQRGSHNIRKPCLQNEVADRNVIGHQWAVDDLFVVVFVAPDAAS